MNSFQELKLPEELARALVRMKFTTPTPIQAQAIPHALAGRDVLGCAQTGTGKTAAFSIPTLVNILENQQKSALVLAPTRELAQQIAEVVRNLLVHAPQIRCVVVIGGAGMQGQVKALAKRPHFIIATPGRLCDHMERRTVDLRNVGTLILDEADRMLDMGFAPQLNQILRGLPQQRQTLLFSATMAPEVQKLAMQMLRDPVQVTVGEISKPIEKIEQEMMATTPQEKNNLLMDQLNAREGSILIFARTQVRTDRLSRFLLSYGHQVTRIHGGRSQGQRNQAIAGFKDGSFRIMVATDIAARGIDISHIAHVINYDLPMVAEDYVHRIGRTARAGAGGKALSLVTPEEKGLWRDIQRLIDKSGKPAAPGEAPARSEGRREGGGRPSNPGKRFDRNRRFGNRPQNASPRPDGAKSTGIVANR